ncbi:hypothetical protein BDR22DRAFT_230611 [Usnea florida]
MEDQGCIYAGPGWTDIVLDQRETRLSDVDLSVVSESISAFTRLHDLRDPRGSESGLRNVCWRFSIEEPLHRSTTCPTPNLHLSVVFGRPESSIGSTMSHTSVIHPGKYCLLGPFDRAFFDDYCLWSLQIKMTMVLDHSNMATLPKILITRADI